MKHLILGGARSGKSCYAQQLATQSQKDVFYIATALAGDEEMRQRILRHQQERPPQWPLIEEPLFLAEALTKYAANDRCLIVDCLTLWLSNLLCHPQSQLFNEQYSALLAVLPDLPGDIVLVSNEVGLGIIPLGELSRRFVDASGSLHQALSPLCDRVLFMAAGLSLSLK